jgi:cellulose synthase operon protein YhjQ
MEPVSVRPDRVYHLPVVPQDDMAPSRYRQSRERTVIVPQPDPTHHESSESSLPEPLRLDTSRRDAVRRGTELPDDGYDLSRRATDRPHPLRRATDKPESVPQGYAAVRDEAGWFFEPAAKAAEQTREPEPENFATPKFAEPKPSVSAPIANENRAKGDAYAASVSRTRFGGERAAKPYRSEESSSDSRPAYESRRPEQQSEPRPVQRMEEQEPEDTVPAWIHNPQPVQPPPQPVARRVSQPMSPVEDTLQHSRERVAARWFALKGVFEHNGQEPYKEAPVQRAKEIPAPLLTVFSLAGGVGKTSLVATLGRALSATGERVLLTDTTSHGLLPFYFGANELRPGVVRTFSPPSGSADAPIYLVSYDVNQKTGDAASQDWLADEVTKNSRGMQRVLVDLTPSGAWVARKLARMGSALLVPVAPDMNSVISLQGVEKFFAGMVDGDGHAVQPFYLLNQFDASLPLHLDVREVMRQQLGDRLLPFAIRRSPSVSEALAEGMTVMDYAPESTVAGDYMNLVSWLQTQAAPATTGLKNARWSER